jgi:ABC-type transport system involved in Fe-S cluster assembly fused permease/ATPase subunit
MLIILEDALRQTILLLGFTAACCWAVYQIRFSGRKVGDFVMLMTYWSQLTGPLQSFAGVFVRIARSLVDVEKLVEIFLMKPTITAREGAADFERTKDSSPQRSD